MEPTTNIKILGGRRTCSKHKLAGLISKIITLSNPKHMLTEPEIHELLVIKGRLERLLVDEIWNEQTRTLGLRVKRSKHSL